MQTKIERGLPVFRLKRLSRDQKRGFTLIELLTVIAIIGILAAILIPTVTSVKTAANKAKTKATFAQWAASMAMFKQEYGYFPNVVGGSNKLDPAAFFAALTGKSYDGGTPSNYYGNTKKLSFYAPSDSEVTSMAKGDAANGLLKDAFGNTDVVVFIDTNNDGVVSSADSPALSLQSVNAIDGSTWTPTSSNIDTASGVRAGVIFYSAGKGSGVGDIIYSWQ
jgi:prepilin-type N-terminal cleavage/methylation domain-containing protein